jgi:FkbM family methyltransferase
MKIIKKILLKKKEKASTSFNKNSFYNVSSTCQIKVLPELLERYLGKIRNGYFVEFGAYDGEYASNTSGLADMGWHGLYLEPVKKFFEMAKARHINNTSVKVVNIAVGDERKCAEISIGGPLSTISKETFECFKTFDWAVGCLTDETQKTQQDLLQNILAKHDIPQGFDVLSVDVEGYEYEALRKFNLKDWMPKIIIIELHDNNINYPHEWEKSGKIHRFISDSGYEIIFKDTSNTVYLSDSINSPER